MRFNKCNNVITTIAYYIFLFKYDFSNSYAELAEDPKAFIDVELYGKTHKALSGTGASLSSIEEVNTLADRILSTVYNDIDCTMTTCQNLYVNSHVMKGLVGGVLLGIDILSRSNLI